MTRPPGFLFPDRLTFPRLLAVVAGWLGVLLLPVSIAGLVGAVLAYGGGTDHGASAFAAGGILVAAVLIGVAAAVVRIERGSPPRRLLGATALVLASGFCSLYPLSAIRDPGSFPVTGAIVFAVLAALAALAAWSLVRRR